MQRKRFLNYMFDGILGVKNMYQIEIDYVSKNDAKSTIHKENRVTREFKHPI